MLMLLCYNRKKMFLRTIILWHLLHINMTSGINKTASAVSTSTTGLQRPFQKITPTIKGMLSSSTTTESSISQNVTDQFPNPRIDYRICNRQRPSYICDPDGILKSGEANKLDLFANELRQSTPCLCAKCPVKDGGVQIGVFITYNLTQNNFHAQETNMSAIARRISKKWKLGKCADDIVVVVLAENKKAGFSMSSSVERIFSSKKASKIMDDCVGHFKNLNYYQGLESIINSFRDVLLRFQKLKPATVKKKTGLILGISAGVGILILIVAAAVVIRCKQIYKRTASEKSKSNRDYSGLENVTTKYAYNVYSDSSKIDTKDSDSSSDEGIDLDSEDGGHRNKHYDLLNLPIPPKFCDFRGRQLSDVLEETPEDEEAVAIKYAMTNTPRNCNINVTEL